MMDIISSFKKTRIAPTPSGFLHLGNVLSFAITAALARKTGARILLRIDDLDRERVNREYVQDIFDTLNFLEIPWDEGPANFDEYEKEYSQLHRMGIYQEALQQLKESGHVFACTCSRTQVLRDSPDGAYPGTCSHKGISLDAANASWRLHTNNAKILSVKTLYGKTVTATLPAAMQEFVVRKKDGFPAYQLTSVLDDVYFGVDLVVRGEDLWPSTLAQLYLSSVLRQDAFLDSSFYHHPLLMEAANKKLSKSAGSTSVQYLRKQGRKPAEIFSMIGAMLGLDTPAESWQKLVETYDYRPVTN